MEVDCPPGPRVIVPSNAPPPGGIRGGARVCTEPGCGALIEYDSAVGSRCDRCIIRRKARDFCAMRGGVVNGVGMPLGNAGGNPYIVPVRRPPMNNVSVSGAHQGANPSRPFMLLPHQFQRPSHPPIPHSIGPYVNHFNSRGEMVQFVSRPMVPPLPTSAPIQLCKTPGCNAVLLPQYHYPGRLCKRCQQTQYQFVPPRAPDMQRPPPPPSPPSSKSTTVEEDAAIDLTNLDAGLDDDDDVEMDDLELELTYPELPPATPSPFVTTPLVTNANPRVPPPSITRIPPVPRAPTNHRKRRKVDVGIAESRQTKIKVPVRKTSLKLCSSLDCTGVVSPESRARRCVGCVMRAWRVDRKSVV